MTLTLHIEAETINELHAKAMAALHHIVVVDPAHAVVLTTPHAAAVPTPPEASTVTPIKKGRAKKPVALETDATAAEIAAAAAGTTDTAPDVDTLMSRFKQLVASDYDTAVKVLADLGVDTFAEVVAGDLTRELAAKLATVEAA